MPSESFLREFASMTAVEIFANTQHRAWIYSKVKQIDGEVDDHKDKRNETQVGSHHRHIGKRDRLNEQQAHAWPLKHSFCDDGKRNEPAMAVIASL